MNKNTLNIALCDDISAERNKLKSIIDQYMKNTNIEYEIGEYVSGEELLANGCLSYDIIFLDIFMDDLNGIETAKRIKSGNENAHIVFCSTSNDFAAESYNVSAFYYITKPINEDVLFSVLNRFVEMYYKAQSIEIKVGRDSKNLLVTDIIYAEAQGKKQLYTQKTNQLKRLFCFHNLRNFFHRRDFASQYAMPLCQWMKLFRYRLIILNFPMAAGCR